MINASDDVLELQILTSCMSDDDHGLFNFGPTFVQIQRVPPLHCRYIPKPVETIREQKYSALYPHQSHAPHVGYFMTLNLEAEHLFSLGGPLDIDQ